MRNSKVPFILCAPTNSINREITFLGASSSGRMFEYSVTDEYREELVKVGVTFSVHRPNSFYCPTHVYLCPNKGDTFTHEVEAFTNDHGVNINYFKNLDKDKQKAFVADLRDKEDLKRMAKAQASGLSEEALFKAEYYKVRIEKVRREIALLNAQDGMSA